MSADFVQVATDGSGKKIQSFLNTVGSDSVETQAVVIVDSSAAEITTFPVSDANVGAKADSAASSDTGSFSIIAFIKRSLQNWTTLLAKTWAVTQSGTWTVQPGNTANTTAWKVDGSAVTQPVSGTFYQATQPVSAASLPLPSGAATSAKQDTLDTHLTDGSARIGGTVAVTGSFTVDSELTTSDLDTGAGTDTRAVVGLVVAKSGGAANISTTDPLPVSQQGTVTVDGTVTVTQATGTNLHAVIDSGTVTTVSTITNVVHVDDNSSTLSIDDGAGSITVDGTFWQSTQPVSLASGATAIAKAEDVASADADVGVPAMAIRKATPANTSGTDGDYEMLQVSAGRLWVDASGKTLTVDGSGVTQPVSASSLPLPTLAATSTKQSDGSQKTQVVDGSGNVIGSTSNALDVNIKSGESAGTEYTEDAAAAADPVGGMLIGRRKDTLSATEVSADGDNIALNATNKGQLHVKLADTVTVDASGTAVPITDNSGSLTVDGTVTVTQATGTNLHAVIDSGTVSTITNVVHVDDNSSTLSIDDGAGSITVDGTFWQSTQPVSLASGAAAIAKAEDVASADADVGVPAMAIRKATPANTSGTDGDYEMLQVSAGRLWVDASGKTLTVDASGTAVPITDNSGSLTVDGTVTVTQATGTNLHAVIDSGTVSTITNVVHVDDNSGNLSIDDGGNSITVDGTVTASIASGATTIAKAEDVASADADVGVPAMAIRKATPANTSGTDGDYEMLQVSAGRLWVDASGKTLTVDASGTAVPITDNSGSITVDQATGSNLHTVIDSGTVTTVSTVSTVTNLSQLGGTAVAMNTGTRSAGTQRVTIATDDVVPITDNSGSLTVDNNGTFAVQATLAAGAAAIAKAEDVASADADVGVPAMAIRKATPANTSGTDGDYEMLQVSAGRLWASATIDAALPTGANAIGKLAANSGVTIGAVEVAAAQTLATVTTVSTVTNLSQLGGTAVAMNTGTRSAGTQRVTIATDDIVPAAQSGTWTVQPGNTANTTAWKVDASSVAVPITDNSGSLTVDQATGSNLHTVIDSGTVTTVSTVTNLSQLGGTAVAMNTGTRSAGTQRVTIATDDVVPITDNSGSLTVDNNGTFAVQATLAAGAAAIAKAEDVASADADVGVPSMAVQKATPANTAGTDGDYEMLQMSAGRLWTSSKIDTALPAGSNSIGTVDTELTTANLDSTGISTDTRAVVGLVVAKAGGGANVSDANPLPVTLGPSVPDLLTQILWELRAARIDHAEATNTSYQQTENLIEFPAS